MQVMHSIVLPCHLITVFWLLCLQVKVAGPHSHFDQPLWTVRPSRVTLQAYRLLMQIEQLEPSSSWFIQCKLQNFRFDFRGEVYHMKRKTIQMTRDAKKWHHTVKSYHNYTKVSTGNKTLSPIWIGDLKQELSYS